MADLRGAFTAAVLLIAAAPSASAQFYQPDLPSDRELLAAYCFGLAKHQLEAYKHKGFDRPEAQDRLVRARTYLAARGYLSVRSPIAKNGVDLAIRQAGQDATACEQRTMACLQRCGIGEAADACNSTCQERSRACTAANRCYGDLPY